MTDEQIAHAKAAAHGIGEVARLREILRQALPYVEFAAGLDGIDGAVAALAAIKGELGE